MTKKTETNQILKTIGALITDLREERGVTQSEFAKKIGTTQSAVARMENGEQNMSTAMLSKISEALQKDIVSISDKSINIQIDGGKELSGSIVTKTSKNGAMGLLAASLLNKGTTTLKSMPRIEEVNRMLEIFESLNIHTKWIGNDLEIKPPKKLNIKNLNIDAAIKTRSVIMLIGSLIHEYNSFSIPQPGGCKLGSRTVRPHFYALENLGVKIKATETSYEITNKKLHPSEIVLYESGDTVTENAIIAAALIPGKTVIKYASANYMGQEVCHFLQDLGVKIEGIGTTTITVHGVKSIDKNISYTLTEDPIEVMFFLAVAIVTKSNITIKRCPIDFLEIELLKLEKMGFKYKATERYKAVNGRTDLVDIETFPSKLTALEEKIHPSVYPGLNIDNLPFFTIIATQANGTTLINDWLYEKRMIHFIDLEKLGADVVMADQHRLFVTGPTVLKPAEVICPPALRPGAIILIGMLGAKGISVLRNIYSINRGYEDIVSRLNSIGAKIKILREVEL